MNTILSASASSGGGTSSTVVFFLGVGVALLVVRFYLDYERRVICGECQSKHAEDYCPDCGTPRTDVIKRNVHRLAERHPIRDPPEVDRDDGSESGPRNPDYYCTECGRDRDSGGEPSVCSDCLGDEGESR